tara:strand:- start:1754 stop:2071 length:318 start_codon:yes stop_codon:yes gene_type:complete
MLFWAVNSVFVLFAVLNINDPDWFIWVPTYFLVVASTAAYRENKIKKKTINKVLLYLLFIFIISFFGFVEVFDNSSDTMVNMKEPKREAVGALIAMAWVFWASRE